MSTTDSGQKFETLGRYFLSTVARHGEKVALIYRSRTISWEEFGQSVDRLAKAFLDLGMSPGDRITIQSSNNPEYLYVYLAAARIGAIVVGINITYTFRELKFLAKKFQPTLMIVEEHNQVAKQWASVSSELTSVRHLLVIGKRVPAAAISLNHLLSVDIVKQNGLLQKIDAKVRPEDGVLIVVTGGTTGPMKGALLTHGGIIAGIKAQVEHLNFNLDDRLLLHLPLNHVSGATILAVPPIMTGATLVIHDKFHPVKTMRSIGEQQITILGQVPTMFIMELGLRDFDRYDLSSLRMVIVAGAPTPRSVMERIYLWSPVTIHGYGLTESGGFVTMTSPNDDFDAVCRTVGHPLPGMEIIIVDDFGQPVACGILGEIAVRGPYLMAQYFDDPSETAGAISPDGWLYTGDLGLLDADRTLSLAGLKKDMFISGGYNVYPREIEEYLCQMDGIALVACSGVNHHVMGQVGALFVVLMPGSRIEISDIRDYCHQGLANYKIPRYFRLVDQLPLTDAGKIDRSELSSLL